MTFKQKYYRYSNTWQDKAHIVNVFHKLQMLDKNVKWSMRKTANYFEISVGAVSEACLIGDNIDLVKECKGREDAIGLIRATEGAGIKVNRAVSELRELANKLQVDGKE